MACCSRKDPLIFEPNYRRKALSEKFYARHESLDFSQPKTPAIIRYETAIEKKLRHYPRESRFAPITENQVYGWYENLATRFADKLDCELLNHPRTTDEITRAMIAIVVSPKY